MAKKIKITDSEYKKLRAIIRVYRDSNRLKSIHLINLADQLNNALVVDDGESLTDVVRINTTVVFRNLSSGEISMVTIVFPAETASDGSRISILSPLGSALIGETENSVVECFAPDGRIDLRIEKIIAHHPVISH